MPDARASVLVGDCNLARYESLQGILRDEFNAASLQVKTFDELLAATRQRRWSLILIADDLPFSHANTDVLLSHYFVTLQAQPLGMRLGCIIGEVSADLTGVNPQPFFIHGGCHDAAAQYARLVTELGVVLKRAPRPPAVTLDDDPALRELMRDLGEGRRLDDGLRHVAAMVNDCFACDVVRVSTLTQGLSGARVFRIEPSLDGVCFGEFVLKICEQRDLWKLRLEVQRHAAAKETLGTTRYRIHLAELIKPRFPDQPSDNDLCHVVSHGPWQAVCYDFLGGKQFGQFLDLETALNGPPADLRKAISGTPLADSNSRRGDDSLRLLILETMLDWLRRHWYEKDSLTRREVRLMWDSRDAPTRQFPSYPPYRLAATTKSLAMSFLDGPAATLGPRILPTWQLARREVWDFLEQNDVATGVTTLDRERRVLLAPVHGDLNANNILLWLDEPGHPFLLDLPHYDPAGHALQDFARLEAEIKFGLMDRQHDSPASRLPALDHTWTQFALWTAMEDHLRSRHWRAPMPGSTRGYTQNVHRALRLTQFIRRNAEAVQRHKNNSNQTPSFRDEYLPALLFHTIRAISYTSLPIFKRILAVHSAGSLIVALRRRRA